MTSSTARPTAARDRVPAERVEVLHPVGERVGDGPGRDDRPERVAVAERLAHRDDVRDGAVDLERPPRRPDAPEPDLDLVGDRDGAGGAGRLERAGEEPGRWDDLPGRAERRLRDDGPDRTARRRGVGERRGQVRGVGRPGRQGRAAVTSPVRVRQRRDVHVVAGDPGRPDRRTCTG